jgi:hypothetical protein
LQEFGSIDPEKSASVRNSGISRWRLISGRMGIFQDFHEKAGRCQVVWVVHNLLFFSCPDSCMVLAGEDRGQDRAFWARRDSGRSVAESLDGGRSRPY